MRILIFNWKDIKHPQAGGAELYLHEQAKKWIEKGHEVGWITSKPKGMEKEEIVDGIRVVRSGNKGTSFIWAAINYFFYGKDYDFIIDSGNGFPFFTPTYSRKNKILILYHYHKDVWKKEYGFPVAQIGRMLESFATPFFYKGVKTITISDSTKKDLDKIMPDKKIEVVYCGVGKNFKPGRKSKTPEIIFLGRIKKYKSLDVLLNAISILNKEFPSLKVNIVGTGEDEERIMDLSKKMGLKNVKFKGFVSEGEKVSLLQRAWIMINPSFVEGWSITNMEASACGVPVIGSNVRGVKESVIDGKTGFLFEYGNVQELVEKTRMLLKDNRLRKKMENNSLNHAKEFDWGKSANKMMELIKQEISSKK